MQPGCTWGRARRYGGGAAWAHIRVVWVEGRAAIAPSCRRKRLQGRLGRSPEVEVEVEGSDARASAVGLSESN